MLLANGPIKLAPKGIFGTGFGGEGWSGISGEHLWSAHSERSCRRCGAKVAIHGKCGVYRYCANGFGDDVSQTLDAAFCIDKNTKFQFTCKDDSWLKDIRLALSGFAKFSYYVKDGEGETRCEVLRGVHSIQERYRWVRSNMEQGKTVTFGEINDLHIFDYTPDFQQRANLATWTRQILGADQTTLEATVVSSSSSSSGGTTAVVARAMDLEKSVDDLFA